MARGISPRARVSPPSWWAPEITDLESGCQMALLSLPASKPQAWPGGSWEERHLKEGPPRRAAHPHCWSLGFWRFSASSRLRGQHSRGGAVCSCCFPLWEGHRAGACLQCSPGAERMSHHGLRRDGIPRPARRTGSAWLSPLQPPSYPGAATALMVVVVGSPPEPGRGPVPCPPHPSCERSWEPKVRKPPLLSVFLASVSAARLPLPTWQESWFFPLRPALQPVLGALLGPQPPFTPSPGLLSGHYVRLRSGRGRRREGGGGCGDQLGRRPREDERVVCGQGQVRLTVRPGLWGGRPGEVREGGGR